MEEGRRQKTIKSAFDSSTFDARVSILVEKQPGDLGSATISPSGRDVAIASKTGLEIIDLDSPLNPPRQLRHGISWNVADVQWSPFAARESWVASTSNQKAVVWNLSMADDSKSIEHTLHAHTRAITDINFSAHHPDVLATCAVDGYVHCWDLRKPRRPAMTFVDWDSGATQVKWNRQDSHILASSHDRWLRIWDDRKGAYPLRSIEAHASKIYGVDWNRTRASGIVTCSLDKSIKFWDYTNEEDVPERVIRTAFPVWRARHTPFGWGVLAMPQNSPGTLHLYDRRKAGLESDTAAPAVAVFEGHGEKQVKEFLWRSRGAISEEGIDNREFQLVSWGDDKTLRLQRIDNKTLETVGYVKGSQVLKKLNVTRQGAIYKTFRNVEHLEPERKSATIKAPRYWGGAQEKSALTDGMKGRSPTKKYKSRFGNYGSTIRSQNRVSNKMNQISWMSGVKFDKGLADAAKRTGISARRLSLIGPDFEDTEWESPESLHDEIIRVDGQFSKAKFDDVNMDKREVTVSMNGPWGEGGDYVFLKALIKFPDQYPEHRIPFFEVGKSSMVSDATRLRMINDLGVIANGHLSKRTGCLETVVNYFLGEYDPDGDKPWETSTTDVDDMNDDSSDDDRVDPVGNSSMLSMDMDSSANDMLATPFQHVNVPTPSYCGGRFAPNGKLVCFFPPKAEKFKSLLGDVNLDRGRQKHTTPFNTFSNLKKENLPPKSKFSSLVGDDPTSSESEFSEASSSSDSDSSQFQASIQFDYWRKIHGSNYRKARSSNRSQKSSTVGTGTGTGISKGRLPKPKNTISIHDMDTITPAKRELAQEYKIFGDKILGGGLEVCTQNAEVAAFYGHEDHADIWRYAGMLLQHEVPLEILEDHSARKETILVIARDMINRCRRDSGSDSGVDLSYDTSKKLTARVKWGRSPIAKSLIEDLFDHFEKLADIQMLAMLSCVFVQPNVRDESPEMDMRLSQPQTPLTMKTPAFSLDYFPTDVVAWQNHPQAASYNSTASTPKTSLTPGPYGSYGSAWGSDPTMSAAYSTGNTPPIKSAGGSSERLNQQSQSLSVSPEARSFRRHNSNSTGLASSFASFARPFSATAPSSPPNRKRPSPVESVINTFGGTVTWGATTVLESVKESHRSHSTYSDDDVIHDYNRPIVTEIVVKELNQQEFDDEGCLNESLLDIRHAALFSRYRRAYANMLYSWNLVIPRLEILKFDGMWESFAFEYQPEPFAPSNASVTEKGSIHEVPPSPLHLTRKAQISSARGLDVIGYCLKHDYRLSPDPLSSGLEGGAVGRCERCDRTQRQLQCVICREPVDAAYVGCLSCGCISHIHCRNEYHAAGDVQCPGGCDCNCTEKAGDGTIESWDVLRGAIDIEAMRRLDRRRRNTEEWDEEKSDWESARSVKNAAIPSVKSYSSTLHRKLQARTGEWGTGLIRKGSNLRKEEHL